MAQGKAVLRIKFPSAKQIIARLKAILAELKMGKR